MLSEAIQQRNIKKVKVNAQITFVTYILETVANVSIFFLWNFAYQKNNDFSLILIMLWYHIILSYTFLMNTSHNKNMLVNDSWSNTIRNIVKVPEFPNSMMLERIAGFLQTCKRCRSNKIAPAEVMVEMNQKEHPKQEDRERNI